MKNINNLNNANIPLSCNLKNLINRFEPTNKEYISNSGTYRIESSMSALTPFFYDKSTFIKHIDLTSTNEHQKYAQRISVLQQLNQALDKGVDEFVDVIRSSQISKEVPERKQTKKYTFNVLRKLTNFFNFNKIDYKNGTKNCYDEFIFDSFNRL